jgi:hypothetical protein
VAAAAGSDESTSAVLGRLNRPYQPARVLTALLGLAPRTARQVAGQIMATCEETERLLDAMPRILRSLAIATTDRPERCYGELRGPVLWSETMSARSASAGDPGLFVCSTTTKAYDTVENRVLKAALHTIERAGGDAGQGLDANPDHDRRRARHNELRARHLLEHQALSGVPVTRISGRALRRTRSGSRRSTYEPAVAVLRRAQDPLRAELLGQLDPATTADHELLAAALSALDAATPTTVPLRTAQGALVAGPVRYDPLGGLTVAGVLITAADEIDGALTRWSP